MTSNQQAGIIYEFELDHEDLNYYDPKNAIIHLNQSWLLEATDGCSQKSKNKVNIRHRRPEEEPRDQEPEAGQKGHLAHADGRLREDAIRS